MGRIRSIKPEILEDDKTASLSHLEWRLFVSLFLLADDYGNLRGEVGYIHGAVLWGSRDSREDVAKALDGIARVSLTAFYRVRGQVYIHICGWSKHQKVDKPGRPRMPGISDPQVELIQVDGEANLADRRILAESSRDSRETLGNDLRSPISDLRISDLDHEGERGSGAAPSAGFALSRLKGGSRKSRKPSDPTGSERESALRVLSKLSERSGVQYRGADKHVALIVRQLRDGVTELELRAVVAYCAEELQWQSKPEMREYLRPKTLFGPDKIHDYLDAARTHYAKQLAATPPLTLVPEAS